MAVEIDKDWRKKEESYWEIKKKYPTVSPFVITQIDVQRKRHRVHGRGSG